MRGSDLTRWAPLTGLMSVAFWIAALVVQGGGINTTKSDAEILATTRTTATARKRS